MSRFSIHNAFTNCLPILSSNNAKQCNDDFFIRKLDPSCCAWDRGFYLQLYLVECDFSKHDIDPGGLSQLAITFSPRRTKVKRSSGEIVEYSGIDFFLFINREIFNVTSEMRFWRARCIAHELLIVERYANSFGITTVPPECPHIELPNRHDEDALLCPFEKIEQCLCTIETTYDIKVHTVHEYIANLTQKAGRTYLDTWEQQCVDSQTCGARTVLYLSCAGRATLGARMHRLFKKVCDSLQLKEVSRNEIKMRIKLTDSFYRALLEQSKNEIGEYATEPYIRFLVNRFIDQEWESFKNVYWRRSPSIM